MSNCVFSQFPYGTQLVPASIDLKITETSEEICNGKRSYKTVSNKRYSSIMNANIIWSDMSAALFKMSNNKNLRGTKVILNNYITTFPEGTNLLEYPLPDVAQYPLHFSKETYSYGPDPCNDTYTQPCDDDYLAILNIKEKYEGTPKHNGKAKAKFNCSITGIQNCSEYLFFNFGAGAAYFENGRFYNLRVEGTIEELEESHEDVGCNNVWKSRDYASGIILEMYTDQDDYSETPTANNAWIGKNGVYSKSESVIEEGQMLSRLKELSLMKIDTASFFSYIREKPAMHTFTATGRYYSDVITEGYKKSVEYIYELTLTLGKEEDLVINPTNRDEYEKWMPGHENYPGTMFPLSFKAEFLDPSEADTINFKLFETSRLPGFCTNYPILPEDPPEEEPDIFFAPQEMQTDPEIIVLNDTVAITRSKVSAAEIVVLSRDFGGHAKLSAIAKTNSKTAYYEDEEVYSVTIPYDRNRNQIADAWEKEMGVENIDPKEDNDYLPHGIEDKGDGLTAFEEYRGFISTKDIIANCDTERTLRRGLHVRTSPVCRDAFIHDPNKLFEKYYADVNPAECHWHYLTNYQLTIPSMTEVKPVIIGINVSWPPDNDKSPKANAARADAEIKSQKANEIMTKWIKEEYRRINKNTPEEFRNNFQYALYILESPIEEVAAGLALSYGDDLKQKISPVETHQLIIIPQYKIVKEQTLGLLEFIFKVWENPIFYDKYPPDVRLQVVDRVYEAMIPHEIGHGLGIDHHTKGELKIRHMNTEEEYIASRSNVESLIDRPFVYKEVFYWNGRLSNFQIISTALFSLGVVDCSMRYTTEREEAFLDMSVLQQSMKYCKKGQKFINGDGTKKEADDCFGAIRIKCNN